MKPYHTSVLLHESVDALQVKPGGTYVDATFGGGGHSREILKRLGPDGRLLAFDQDEEAAQNAPDDVRFTFIGANFSALKRFLRLYGIEHVDGIVADLGVSGRQLEAAERGFSYRLEGPLDMRMNRNSTLTAAHILNEYGAEQLQQMWSRYGEVRNARTLAQAVVNARSRQPLTTTTQLREIALQCKTGDEHKYLAQVFQAVRIEVNGEMQALEQLLVQSAEVLRQGGRLAVITFHSLEDRLVKNYMKHASFSDEPEKDVFGRWQPLFRVITRKPITAGEKERRENPRSHSAKLRVAERI